MCPYEKSEFGVLDSRIDSRDVYYILYIYIYIYICIYIYIYIN